MARTEKKSRLVGLPPKLILQERDSVTGSFPTKARTAVSDNRTGKFGVAFDDTNVMIFTSSTDSGTNTFYYGQNIQKVMAERPAFSRSLGKGFFEVSGGISPDNHYITASSGDTRFVRAGVSDEYYSRTFMSGQNLSPFRDHNHPAVDGKSQGNSFYATGSEVATFGEGLDQPLWSKSKIEIDLTPSRVHSFGIQNYLSTSKNHPMAYWNKDAKIYEGIGPGTEFDVYHGVVNPGAGTTDPANFVTCSMLFEEQTVGFASSMERGTGQSVRDYTSGEVISNYHFPYHAKYHATSSNLIPMSEFISEPFLVEKIVLEFSGTYSKNNTYSSDNISRAMCTFFIMNQFGQTTFDFEQTVMWQTISETTAIISASLPGRYVKSGSYSNRYGGASPPLLSDLIKSRREIITFLNISAFPGGYTPGFEVRLSRDYDIVGDASAGNYWSGKFIVSGSAKNFWGQGTELLGYNEVRWYEGSVDFEYIESSAYSGRSGLGGASGRSLLNVMRSPPASTDITGAPSFPTRIFETYETENPYLLLPTDNLVFGWQVPMSNQAVNVRGTVVIYNGLGPQLEFAASPSKVTIYGSLLREGKEHHGTLNQLLSSNTVHEEIG